MGLDSVELVVEFEEYFNVTIPDREAELIGTVEQAAACVARLRAIPMELTRSAIYYRVLEQVLACLRGHYPSISEGAWVSATGLLPKQLFVRYQPEEAVQLRVPSSFVLKPPPTGWLQRIFSTPPQPASQSLRFTVADLTDWVISLNYRILLPTPTTLYEVQRAVIGISSEKLGIAIQEIKLTDSFVNDLGVD